MVEDWPPLEWLLMGVILTLTSIYAFTYHTYTGWVMMTAADVAASAMICFDMYGKKGKVLRPHTE